MLPLFYLLTKSKQNVIIGSTGGVIVKKSFKNICSIIGAVVVISLFVTLIINFIPEKICVSAKIVGENGNVLFEEDNIELLKQKDTVLTLNEAVVQVLDQYNIEYTLNEDSQYIITGMFGLEQYVNEMYADSGAYWRMYANTDMYNKPSEIEVKNGDTIICEWCVYDRHQYCDHN